MVFYIYYLVLYCFIIYVFSSDAATKAYYSRNYFGYYDFKLASTNIFLRYTLTYLVCARCLSLEYEEITSFTKYVVCSRNRFMSS